MNDLEYEQAGPHVDDCQCQVGKPDVDCCLYRSFLASRRVNMAEFTDEQIRAKAKELHAEWCGPDCKLGEGHDYRETARLILEAEAMQVDEPVDPGVEFTGAVWAYLDATGGDESNLFDLLSQAVQTWEP